METRILPVCLAMVLCDGLHQSPSTGKISLLDIIGNRFEADAFPQLWSTIVVYLSLTSIHGSVILTLRWIGPDGHPLPGPDQHREIEFADPLSIYEVFFYCDDLVFPEPGEYGVELIVADEIVVDRRLFVFLASSQEH
jgi:hypothetical protein